MFRLTGQIFIGLIVGVLAKLIMPGKDQGGVILMALIGLAGSAAGTLIGHVVFSSHHAAGWILSIGVSIALLCIYLVAVRARPGSDSTTTGEGESVTNRR